MTHAARIPQRVFDGLYTLVAHAGAGNHEDLEIDIESRYGQQTWANVLLAMKWMDEQSDLRNQPKRRKR